MSLLIFEEFKQLKKNKTILFYFVIMIFFGCVFVLLNIDEFWLTNENAEKLKGFSAVRYDKTYSEKFNGVMTEEKWHDIYSGTADQTHIHTMRLQVSQGVPSPPQDFFAVPLEKLQYEYSRPYEFFIFSYKIIMVFFLVFTILISFSVFARERLYDTTDIIFACKYSKTKQITAKLLFLILFVSTTFLIITTLIFVLNGAMFGGYVGGTGSIQLGTENLYTTLAYSLNWSGLTLITVLFAFLGHLFSVCLVMFTTAIFKKIFVSVPFVLLLVIAPSFISEKSWLSFSNGFQLLAGFPTFIYNLNYNLLGLSTEKTTSFSRVLVMIVFSVGVSILLVLLAKVFWKKQKI